MATDFLDKIEEVEKHLLKHPEIGSFDKEWNCRKFLIAPPVYMFYDIIGDKIYIKYFWKNRQKPLFD